MFAALLAGMIALAANIALLSIAVTSLVFSLLHKQDSSN